MTVAVAGSIGEQADHVIGGRFRIGLAIQPFEIISGILVAGNQFLHQRYTGGIERLIGVQDQYPFAGGKRKGTIARSPEVDHAEIKVHHLRAMCRRDRRGAIGRPCVHHNDFRREASDGIETSRKNLVPRSLQSCRG